MNLVDYFQYKNVVLCPIEDSDIDSTVALINPAYSYQEAAKGETRTNPEHLRKRVSETDFFVTKKDDKIVGCVYTEPNGDSLHFGLLTVSEDMRGSGLAQAMMKAIEDYAKASGYKSVGLAYMSLAPWLKKYYTNYGFKETGEVVEWGSIDLIWMDKSV